MNKCFVIFVDEVCHSFLADQGLDVLETLLKNCTDCRETEILVKNILIHLASTRGRPSSLIYNSNLVKI